MAGAKPTKVVQLGRATEGVVQSPVVDLQMMGNRAAGDHALGVTVGQGHPKSTANSPRGGRHRLDVDSSAHQERQPGVSEKGPGTGEGNGAETGDLTDLISFERTPLQGLGIHPNEHMGQPR